MAKISDLKKSIKEKNKAKRIYEEMKKDAEMDEVFAEVAGLVWDEKRNEDGHDDGQYIGSKTQWEIFNRLNIGELQICSKCGEITKGEGSREYTLCGNCSF